MDTRLLILLVFAVMAIGLIATLWVGFSKANREGDPGYEKKTGSKWVRLALLYAVTVAAAVVAFFVLLRH